MNKHLMEKLLLMGSTTNGEENKMDTNTSQTDESLSLDVMDTSEQPSSSRTRIPYSSLPRDSNGSNSAINVMLSYLTKCYEKANKEEKIMLKVRTVHVNCICSHFYIS